MLPRELQPLPALKSLSKFEGLKLLMSRALSLSFCFLSCGEWKGAGEPSAIVCDRVISFATGDRVKNIPGFE